MNFFAANACRVLKSLHAWTMSKRRCGRAAFGTWTAAKAGADAAASAATQVDQGARAAFCCTRPPGHHAGPDFMGGYCFLNNAAVAAQALRNQGAQRVALLDVDYHHGNGTQSIFYDRAD